MTFVQALPARSADPPVPLSGGPGEKVVDIAIQRTLVALRDREDDVLLVSNDGDFVEQIGNLLDGRRVGVIGFTRLRNSAFVLAERGLESFDLEYDVQAFNERLPRVPVASDRRVRPRPVPLTGKALPGQARGAPARRRRG